MTSVRVGSKPDEYDNQRREHGYEVAVPRQEYENAEIPA